MVMITKQCEQCKKNFTRDRRHINANKSGLFFCGQVCARKFRSNSHIFDKKSKYNFEVGQKLGRITLIESILVTSKNGVNRTHWRCRCECGTICVRREDYLGMLSRKNKTTYCGLCNPNNRRGKKNHFWKGTGDISATFYNNQKYSAFRRNLEFEVTKEQLWEKFLEQDRKCALTGIELRFSHKGKPLSDGTASIDRIDSTKDYTIDNVQWVHKRINRMKHDCSQEEFIQLCKLVAKNHS